MPKQPIYLFNIDIVQLVHKKKKKSINSRGLLLK